MFGCNVWKRRVGESMDLGEAAGRLDDAPHGTSLGRAARPSGARAWDWPTRLWCARGGQGSWSSPKECRGATTMVLLLSVESQHAVDSCPTIARLSNSADYIRHRVPMRQAYIRPSHFQPSASFGFLRLSSARHYHLQLADCHRWSKDPVRRFARTAARG